MTTQTAFTVACDPGNRMEKEGKGIGCLGFLTCIFISIIIVGGLYWVVAFLVRRG